MNKDKVAGAAESLAGRAESAAGTLIGDDRMVTRGDTQQATGKVRNIMGSL